MKAIDFDNMSDEEFAKMFEEFDNKMDKFLEQDDFFNRFEHTSLQKNINKNYYLMIHLKSSLEQQLIL